MEPEMSSPHPSQETGPVVRGSENAPSFSGVERNQSQPQEYAPRTETRETLPAPSGGGGDPTFVAPLPPPVSADPQQVPPGLSSSAPSVDDNPITAADEDLIEKEWVNRAKKIISRTKSDPYLQEKEVSKLQADYLKKRYGKEVKLPTE